MRIRVLVPAFLAALALAAPAIAAPPSVHARAYFIENAATGETLAAYHARQRLPMASITKLMTVLLTLEHAKLGATVTVGRGVSPGGSSIYLHQGDRLTVRELVEGALIQSANDAAVALADYVGHGDRARFIAMMNRRARQLGLRDTHFVRPDGLDAPRHYSSARDLTLLGRVLMNKPFVRKTVRMRSATIAGGRHLTTWNDLLSTFPGVIGVKTGHTGNAGWCQVAAVRAPGMTVYATILGEPTRAERNDDLAKLLRWGLSRYRVTTLIGPHRVYATARTSFGRGPVELVAEHGVRTPVRVGRRLREEVVAPTAVALPVDRGERFGVVRVYDRNRVVASAPLVAAKSMSDPGVASRAGWYATRVGKTIVGWLP
ncbi:MAG TPA: D-alanyl-D-alanine carboxypeptidase family protein [Gaiellaceae bacterium]|nr:D-alanyl-D-alanine carboxypeptidase family protein [Gaiellaceae bacterium]